MQPLLTAYAQSGDAAQQLAPIVAALRANQFEQAVTLSEDACKRTPQDARPWTLKGLALSGLQRRQAALDAYREALTLAPTYLPALKGAAETAFALRDPGASEILARLVQLQPDDAAAHAMLGDIELRGGHCQEAAMHLSKTGNLLDRQKQILEPYSRCLVTLGDYQEAARIFDSLAALEPSSDEPRYNGALALSKLGRWEQVLAHLQPLTAGTSPSEDVLTLAAQAEEQLGHLQPAVDDLRRAISLSPHDPNAYLEFINLAYRHESVPVGLEIVSMGVVQNPNSAELHFARGVLLCGLGRTAEGLPELEKANQLNPTLAAMRYADGIAEDQANHSEAAVAQFREATVQHPQDPLAWYLLAEALTHQQVSPDSPAFAEVERAGQRAIALNPDQPRIYDLMASFYLQTEHTQQAAAMSEAALKRDPADVQALYHMVLLTRKSGDKEKLNSFVQRLVAARSQESREGSTIKVQRLTLQPNTSR